MVNSFLNRSRLNRISHKRLFQSFIFCNTVNLCHSIGEVVAENGIQINHLSEECGKELLVWFSIHNRRHSINVLSDMFFQVLFTERSTVIFLIL